MKLYFTKLKENDKIDTVNVLEKGLSIYRRSDLMSLKQKILDARDNYVINQVKAAQLPEFKSMEIRRYRITFYGRVQNVGFRSEVTEMAKRLGLTGFCNNQEDKSVVMEVQGQFDKIKFLVAFMKSLKRIVVKRVDTKRLPLDFTEVGFISDDED